MWPAAKIIPTTRTTPTTPTTPTIRMDGPHMEETPAYISLKDAGVLCTDHRRNNIDDIFTGVDVKANTNKSDNFSRQMKWTLFGGCFCYGIFNTEIFVPASHVGFLMDEKNNYLFLQPGMHNISGYFMHIPSEPKPLRGHIRHGNRTILVIEQGFLGYATDNGQPVLLPPGIHVWTSESLEFLKSISLSAHLIHLGPYTLVTVDEGYVAITQNNGKQVILSGGHSHFLNHINWKFEKFMSMKIQTDELDRTIATSADNVEMEVYATVNWKIIDAKVAAIMAAETMQTGESKGETSADIKKLRRDVLKQALASLSAFIGSVNYSGSFNKKATKAGAKSEAVMLSHVAVAEAEVVRDVGTEEDHRGSKEPSAPIVEDFMENPLYNVEKMDSAMQHANMVTSTYGVEIMSVNIISATPLDKVLKTSLASGAVSSAEALNAELDAGGKAKAMLLEARARYDADLLKAEGDAKGILIIAKANKESAILKAEGEAEAVNKISLAIQGQGGDAAMKQRLAQQYLSEYSKMASTAQLIVVPDRPNDVSGVLTTALGLSKALDHM